MLRSGSCQPLFAASISNAKLNENVSVEESPSTDYTDYFYKHLCNLWMDLEGQPFDELCFCVIASPQFQLSLLKSSQTAGI
jgi:hypothetical protein